MKVRLKKININFVSFLDSHIGPKIKYWTIRKITFVAILISISLVLAIIGGTIIPIASIPSYRLSFTGLPIKISGFIFGPFIGFFIGLISDILSLFFLPSFIHWGYTLVSIINGIIPGLIAWFFFKFLNNAIDKRKHLKQINQQIRELKFQETIEIDDIKRLKYVQKKIRREQDKISKIESNKFIDKDRTKLLTWIYLLCTYFIMIIVVATTIIIVFSKQWFNIDIPNISPEEIGQSILGNPIVLVSLTLSSFVPMAIFLFVYRFFVKPEKFFVISTIVLFSILLEVINVYLLAFADKEALNLNFVSALVQHIMFSPFKIWINLTVIYFSYRVIFYLLNKNENIYL